MDIKLHVKMSAKTVRTLIMAVLFVVAPLDGSPLAQLPVAAPLSVECAIDR